MRHAFEFILILISFIGLLVGMSRFGLRPLARGLQRSRGYSDQFFVEMTVAVPIALFLVIGALLIVLLTD